MTYEQINQRIAELDQAKAAFQGTMQERQSLDSELTTLYNARNRLPLRKS